MVIMFIAIQGGETMPVYSFECIVCGEVKDFFEHSMKERNSKHLCSCGNRMDRAMNHEGVLVIPDMEPGFQESAGEYISSRKDWRESLARNNAHDPNLFMNSNPSAGRITEEERRNLEVQTIFDKRQRAGWGKNPAESEDSVVVEGSAEPHYREIRRQAKEVHKARREGAI